MQTAEGAVIQTPVTPQIRLQQRRGRKWDPGHRRRAAEHPAAVVSVRQDCKGEEEWCRVERNVLDAGSDWFSLLLYTEVSHRAELKVTNRVDTRSHSSTKTKG